MSDTQIYLLYDDFFTTFNKLKNNFIPKIIQKIEYRKPDINQWIIEYCNKHYKIYKLNIENNYIMYVIYKILTFVGIQKHPYLSEYHHLYEKKMKGILFGSNNGYRNECKILTKEHFKYKKNNIHSNTKKLLFN